MKTVQHVTSPDGLGSTLLQLTTKVKSQRMIDSQTRSLRHTNSVMLEQTCKYPSLKI